MKLPESDKKLLKELCEQKNVKFYKVLKLLDIERTFELKERRIGIYEALKDIIIEDISI